MEKTIEVPVHYYQLLAVVALNEIDRLEAELLVPGKSVAIVDSICLARLKKWQVWHDGAEELGLLRDVGVYPS